MKMTQHILTIGILTTFFSCGQPSGKRHAAAVIIDTAETNFDKEEKKRLEKRRKIEEQDYLDSLRLDKVLRDALKIAYQSIKEDKFIKKYEDSPDSVPVSVELNLNYHFNKTNPHLIIRRTQPGVIYIDIYSKNDNKYENVISHEQWTLTYVNDIIRDINGDGLKDFVVNWYGASGCCLKAFSNVYLIRQDKKTFSENFEFINPTFSPKENVIRGICYGHPGKTELYKYKWNGEQIDTLEYVSYETNNEGLKTGKILISAGKPYGDKVKQVKLLNSVPAEYKKIKGYDWFTGKGYR